MKKHYLGAVYEVNKQNMNHLIEQLDKALSENKLLTQVTDERDQMADTCISMSQEIDELKRENEELREAGGKIIDEDFQNRLQWEATARERDELKRENEKLKNNLNYLELLKTEYKLDFKKVTNERDSLAKQLDELKRENEKLKEQCSGWENGNAELSHDVHSLAKQNEILNQRLDEISKYCEPHQVYMWAKYIFALATGKSEWRD